MAAQKLNTDGSFWTIQSSTGSTKTVAVVFGAVGLLFLWLTSKAPFVPEKETELLAAFWLGVILFGIAGWVFLFIEHVVIVVDEQRKMLRISRQSLTGTRSSIYRFGDLESIQVISLGQSHRGVVTHHLMLAFKNGTTFPTQYWSTSHAQTTELAEKLAQATGSPVGSNRRYNPVDTKMFLISGVGAVLIYCAWYKFMVGPFCLAMWFGTAPAVIMVVAFFAIFRLCRQLPNF